GEDKVGQPAVEVRKTHFDALVCSTQGLQFDRPPEIWPCQPMPGEFLSLARSIPAKHWPSLGLLAGKTFLQLRSKPVRWWFESARPPRAHHPADKAGYQ